MIVAFTIHGASQLLTHAAVHLSIFYESSDKECYRTQPHFRPNNDPIWEEPFSDGISDAIFLFVLKDPKTGNFLGERKLYLQTLFERSNEILHEKLELWNVDHGNLFISAEWKAMNEF